MTALLADVAWWILFAQINAAAWLTISCLVGTLCVVDSWRPRL